MTREQFAKELRHKRWLFRLSQRKMALVLGVPSSTYEKWERMEGFPSQWAIRLILAEIDRKLAE